MLTATVQLQQMMATEFGAAQGCEAYGRWCSSVWCKVPVVSQDHAFIFMVYKFRKTASTAWSWRQRHKSLLKLHEPLCQCHSITSQKTPIHSNITVWSFNSALYQACLTLQTKTKEEKDCAKNCSHHLTQLVKLPFNSANAVHLHWLILCQETDNALKSEHDDCKQKEERLGSK